MRKKFCCDTSRSMYEDYYMKQSGDGMPIFIGSRGQKGSGIGSVLSGLFRSALPVLKKGLATFGKHALKTGTQILSDVVDGQPIGESAKKRIREGIKDFISSRQVISPEEVGEQTGNGRKRSYHKIFTKEEQFC